MLVASFVSIFAMWYIGLIMAFLGMLIISSRYKLVIDPDQMIIDDFLEILKMKSKHKQFRYKKLKYVLINSSRFTQQLNYKSISSNISGMLYSAYLVCDDQKHFLGDSQDLGKLLIKVKSFAEKAGVEVRDHSRVKN